LRSGGRLKLFLVELSKGMLQLVKPFLLGVSDRPQPQEAVLAHDVAKAMASLAELLGALSSVKNEHDLGQQLVVEREQRHMRTPSRPFLPANVSVNVNVNVNVKDHPVKFNIYVVTLWCFNLVVREILTLGRVFHHLLGSFPSFNIVKGRRYGPGEITSIYSIRTVLGLYPVPLGR